MILNESEKGGYLSLHKVVKGAKREVEGFKNVQWNKNSLLKKEGRIFSC